MKEKLVKSILNKKKKRDDWFLDDYTLNPYEGCSFNCQYCYVRGSKYGLNMAETLTVKVNSLEILEKQLASRAKKNQYGIIALASATDPYLRAEEQYKLTRGFLQLILKYRFPVLLLTKSTLILRDIDLLKEIDSRAIHSPDLLSKIKNGCIVAFSFSTLEDDVAATLEPGAPSPSRRLETLKKCKEANLLTGVNLMPVLPFINDTREQLNHMLGSLARAGADFVLASGLTLFGSDPWDSKPLYYNFLTRRYPQLIPDYEKLYAERNYPTWKYNQELMDKIQSISATHNIRNSILTL